MLGRRPSLLYTNSFARFDYPSRMSPSVLARMRELTVGAIEAFDLGNCQFNVEIFHDRETERLGIIEINPRMSYQFSDLFGAVDGVNSYEILCALVTGQRPAFTRSPDRS